MEQNIQSIPKEKFNFVQRNDLTHDKKLATKPRGYFADAFVRFCKNKGAVVGAIIIIILVLCSIIAPMCTPYDVKYMDSNYKSCFPDNPLFAGLPVWDGCEERNDSKGVFMKYYAMGEETGLNAVKNQAYRIEDDLYVYRLNSVHSVGAKYISLTMAEYAALQAYQDANDVQVIYPMVMPSKRPQTFVGKTDANYYFETKVSSNKIQIVYDKNGNVIPVYATNTAEEYYDDNGVPVD